MSEPTSRDVVERGLTFINRRLNDRKATKVAVELGWSDGELSKFRGDPLLKAMKLIAAVGGKVVPADAMCMSRVDHEFLTSKVARQMQVAGADFWSEDAE